MEDMCQLTEKLTEDKYKGSMEKVGKVILNNSTNRGLDALRFFEVILFSFLTGNADMHLKNFSFIYNEEKVMLSPAYDLLLTRLVIPEGKDPEETASTLNRKKSKFNKEDLLVFGGRLILKRKQIDNVFERFVSHAGAASELIGESFLTDENKEKSKNPSG
jgi:serine/threonine-protein kinase HipA